MKLWIKRNALYSFFSPVPNDPLSLACGFSSFIYRCCSDSESCPSLCDPVECSTPGFPVHHHLPEFAQTHVHWLHDAVQPSLPVVPFPSCPPSFPASGSFPLNQPFPSGGQSIGASPSTTVLPKDIQGWFPLGLPGLSLCCPWASQESSQPHSVTTSFLYGPSLTPIYLFVLHPESNGHRLVIS